MRSHSCGKGCPAPTGGGTVPTPSPNIRRNVMFSTTPPGGGNRVQHRMARASQRPIRMLTVQRVARGVKRAEKHVRDGPQMMSNAPFAHSYPGPGTT